MKIIQVLVVTCIAATMGGCYSKINLNTGETDYRTAEGASGKLEKKYKLPADASERFITANDESVAIILKQAFIEDFSERTERFFAGLQSTTVRGEIAIVANVFEMSDGKNLDFGDTLGKSAGRLIYYSEDVRSGGEFLDLSGVPIYGPIKYTGKPIAIRLSILELDNSESAQIKGLLSVLAALGKKAYAPASPILTTLDALGAELLSGEQDDLELQYAFYLYPESGVGASNLPRLLVGDYVFIRAEPEKLTTGRPFTTAPWDDICLDIDDGRLLKIIKDDPEDDSNDADGCNGSEYIDRTYFVVNVQKGLPSVGLDTAQEFAKFESTVMSKTSKDYSTFEATLGKAIDEFKEVAVESKRREQRQKVVLRAVDQLKLLSENKGRERQLIALALFDTLTIRQGFPLDTTTNQAEAFSPFEGQTILSEMRRLAIDPDKVSLSDVTNPADAPNLSGLILGPK